MGYQIMDSSNHIKKNITRTWSIIISLQSMKYVICICQKTKDKRPKKDAIHMTF